MEIMLSHLGVGMAYDALDGLDIHAQRLHLRHIGVAAAVRREQADIARFFQRFAEYIPEMGGIAGQARLGAFPDELVGGIPQLDGTRADILVEVGGNQFYTLAFHTTLVQFAGVDQLAAVDDHELVRRVDINIAAVGSDVQAAAAVGGIALAAVQRRNGGVHLPNLDAMIENFDKALSHPDADDLERLKQAVR